MTSYSLQFGLNGQYPPQKAEREQHLYDQYPPQAFGAQHAPYYPPPYAMPPFPGVQNPFPGAPTPFPDHRIPPQHQYAPPGQYPPPAKGKLYELTVGQEVEVCVKSNVFVVGLVVSVLTFFEKIAGLGYEIRYRTLGGGESTDVFPVDRIRTR
ncbi:hypothetical protein WG66_008589 [Moniliophthora roreri]|uniref:Uncharacterized protein n=1 Tax=Moniliophthora roreri TaxID=221103 RepID=A0A0W0F375_MONRR|nr:hypothetical protein WG66_008589 [Moniliophthora roreri]